MHPDYRKHLLATLSDADQRIAEADTILAVEPISDDDRQTVETLRGMLAETRERIDGKLREE